MTTALAAAVWREPIGLDDRFTFVLPAGWLRLRAGPAAALEQDLRRVVAAMTDRPDRAAAAAALDTHLRSAASAARRAQALEVHLPAGGVGEPLLACALSVSVLSSRAAPADHAAVLLATARPGDDTRQVPGADGPVTRVARRLDADAAAGRAHAAAVVQHLHPAPDGRAVLLTGSTPQVDLAGPFATVFDAVSASLRWLA